MPDEVKDTAAVDASADAAAVTAAASADAAATPVAAAIARVVPETYTLALPEKSLLDPAAIDRISALATANKLTQDEAAAVLLATNGEVSETLKVLEAAQAPPSKENPLGGTLYQARVRELEAASLAHPDLGNGDPQRLKAASLKAQLFLTQHLPELAPLLDRSGDGSNPVVLVALNRLAAMIGEKPHVKDMGAPAQPKVDRSGRGFYAPDGGKLVAADATA